MDNGTVNPERMVTLSETALARTKRFYAETGEYHGKKLRLYLDGKGCDGFFYGVSFDEPIAGDLTIPQAEGVDVIVDEKTLAFVKGSIIDWVDDERGQGYLVENPNHRKFRGKFFKRPSWQKQALGEKSPPST